MQAGAPAARPWTVVGLVIALLGLPAIVFAYRLVVADPTAGANVALREAIILALVALLLWIVVRRERRPLSSIGIGGAGLWPTLGWAFVLLLLIVLGLAACLGMFALSGVHYGQGSAPLSVSPWATALTTVRAGVAEEVFYRGYAIERIEAMTGSRWAAALIPLIMFAAFHYRQGLPGIIVALVLGAILTAFYLWKRNLIANILAHFLVDFVPNVVLPLLAGE
jgi:CAAX protease family protein